MFQKIKWSLAFCLLLSRAALIGQDIENSLLWSIHPSLSDQPDSIVAPSYLFGTIHMIDRDLFFIPDTLNSILQEVDEIYFEIDTDNLDASILELFFSMQDKIFFPEGQSIDDYLAPEDGILLDSVLSEQNFPSQMIKSIKPMFLSIIISQSTSSLSAHSYKSYEMVLHELAKAQNLSIKGLESIAEQLSIFDKNPIEQQVEELLTLLKSPSDLGESDLDSLNYYYIHQNLNALDKLISKNFVNSSNMEDQLLKNRNEKWIKKIEEELKMSNQVLYAVGAGHLGGDHGVIALLRNAGYIVEPIIFEWKKDLSRP